MYIRRTIRRLIFLAIVALALAGCAPHSLPAPSIPPPPTASLAPTAPPPATATPTPLPTDTQTLTPTPKPKTYPIDKAKLFNNMPKSYAELLASVQAGDGKYVEAPDPLADPQAGQVFLDWVKNQLIPALGGDELKLPRVASFIGSVILGDWQTYGGSDADAKPLEGQPGIVFIQHGSKVYPMLILPTSGYLHGEDYDTGTIMVILEEMQYDGYDVGWGSLAKLAEGQPIMSITTAVNLSGPGFTPFEKQAVEAGLNGSDYVDGNGDHWYMPAAGFITMKGEH